MIANNCNSFNNSLLKYSGSSNQESTDFKGNDAGRNNLINVNYFENNSR